MYKTMRKKLVTNNKAHLEEAFRRLNEEINDDYVAEVENIIWSEFQNFAKSFPDINRAERIEIFRTAMNNLLNDRKFNIGR